jgi:hypothetical protein
MATQETHSLRDIRYLIAEVLRIRNEPQALWPNCALGLTLADTGFGGIARPRDSVSDLVPGEVIVGLGRKF